MFPDAISYSCCRHKKKVRHSHIMHKRDEKYKYSRSMIVYTTTMVQRSASQMCRWVLGIGAHVGLSIVAATRSLVNTTFASGCLALGKTSACKEAHALRPCYSDQTICNIQNRLRRNIYRSMTPYYRLLSSTAKQNSSV